MNLLSSTILALKRQLQHYCDKDRISVTLASRYRLIEHRYWEDPDALQLLYQVIGTNNFSWEYPTVLYKDDAMIRGFSQEDVRTITLWALYQQRGISLHTIKFEGYRYSSGEETAVFTNTITNEKFEKTIKEFNKAPEIIRRIDPDSAFNLGVSYGESL